MRERERGPAATAKAPLQDPPPREVQQQSSTRCRGRSAVPVGPLLPYGEDYPDLGTWADRDGTVYRGFGPYHRRWTRRLRRRLRPRSLGWWR